MRCRASGRRRAGHGGAVPARVGGQGNEQARAVARALVGLTCEVQHVAVRPGLAAKPVLDLVVAVAPSKWPRAVERLAGLHFQDLGEAGVPGRRYLCGRTTKPAANVHLLESDGQLWTDNLLLRELTCGPMWRRQGAMPRSRRVPLGKARPWRATRRRRPASLTNCWPRLGPSSTAASRSRSGTGTSLVSGNG